MQCLIDFDVLVYEIGYGAESGRQQPGFPPFDYVAEKLDNAIANICAITESTEPPILYVTGKTNFRNEIAKRQKYKDRPGNKPFHYKNILAYGKAKYDVRTREGLEADDLMAIEQSKRPTETIICTRDKDLRAVEGWHYGWELGAQPQFGPEYVTGFGYIRLSNDRKTIKGVGSLFFFSQCLTGDKVDSIPGIPNCGAVKAYTLLEHAKTAQEAFKIVLDEYIRVFGGRGPEELLEQGRLLHMTRELHPDGSPVLWELPLGN